MCGEMALSGQGTKRAKAGRAGSGCVGERPHRSASTARSMRIPTSPVAACSMLGRDASQPGGSPVPAVFPAALPAPPVHPHPDGEKEPSGLR